MRFLIGLEVSLSAWLAFGPTPVPGGPLCNEIPVGVTPNFLPFRADPNGDCTIDFRDLFEIALDWDGGLALRGYRVDPEYLLQVRTGRARFHNQALIGDVDLDGAVDNTDLDFFILNQDRGLSNCACGSETEFAWFPYTMDLNRDGSITREDTGLFNCVLSEGGTCTPTPTFTPTPTNTASNTPSRTLSPTNTGTPTVSPTRTNSPTPCSQGVGIPDNRLNEIVREALSKPTGLLTACDLESLIDLTVINSGVKDLRGLQFAKNLEILALPISEIVDLAPLSSLTNLTVLNLSNNKVVDLGPLAGLPNLNSAFLQSNLIIDLEPLVNSSALSPSLTLALNGNPLSATAQCEQIPELRARGITVRFDLTDGCGTFTPTPTITPSITRTPSMTRTPTPTATPTATCGVVNIADIDLERVIRVALEKADGELTTCDLESLTVLHAPSNQGIENLEGFQYAKNLQSLSLVTNQIADLSPLAGLTQLANLDLTSNEISNIGPLSSLVNLVDLRLSSNDISSIDALSALSNLQTLFLGSNQIENIESLANLNQLSSLNLMTNEVIDAQPLVDNPGLGLGDIVDLGGNPLSATAECIQIPALIDRFVQVQFNSTVQCD